MRTTVSLEGLRLDRGYSVRQCAAAIHISRAVLERAERGLGIHPGSAKKIADFYGYKVTELWPLEADESVPA